MPIAYGAGGVTAGGRTGCGVFAALSGARHAQPATIPDTHANPIANLDAFADAVGDTYGNPHGGLLADQDREPGSDSRNGNLHAPTNAYRARADRHSNARPGSNTYAHPKLHDHLDAGRRVDPYANSNTGTNARMR